MFRDKTNILFQDKTDILFQDKTDILFQDKTNPKFVITRARTKILKGEEITFHYTGGLKGRFMRRKALK